MQGLPLARAAVLGSFAGQVAALRDGALGRYIEEQADYFRFSRVLEFSRVRGGRQDAGCSTEHLGQPLFCSGSGRRAGAHPLPRLRLLLAPLLAAPATLAASLLPSRSASTRRWRRRAARRCTCSSSSSLGRCAPCWRPPPRGLTRSWCRQGGAGGEGRCAGGGPAHGRGFKAWQHVLVSPGAACPRNPLPSGAPAHREAPGCHQPSPRGCSVGQVGPRSYLSLLCAPRRLLGAAPSCGQRPHLPLPHRHAAHPPRLERVCLERWGRMEEQLRQCYSGIELKPPPAELRRWFQAAKAAGP